MKTYKRLILSNVLLFVVTALFAAEAPDVSVTVRDSKTKEAIGFATVELLNAKDSVITGGITNDKGFLTLPCTIDSAKIRIQYLGYKTYQATVANKNIGTVLMDEDAQLLKEVTVTGSARTTKIDRDIFVITKEMKEGTALSRELLGKLNGVIYNPIDQSIMVNGSTNILILIDGIEKDQNMAKTLSPDRIDKVEIIKDPVGKYAADGYRAVINIITKKDYSGIDVTANTNPMFNFTNYNSSPSAFLQENSTINILYNYKKIDIYGGYWGNYFSAHLPTESAKQYGDLLVTTPPMNNKYPTSTIQGNYNTFWMGGDYLINPDNTLSLDLHYNGNVNKNTSKSDLTSFLNGTPISKSQSENYSRNTGDALQTTLTYHAKWDKKSNFEANFRYQYSTPTNRTSFVQDAMQNESYNTQGENFYRLNLEYNYQFTDIFSMNIAYGFILDNFRLHQNNQTLKQNQVRNRPSIYLSYAPFKQLNMKVGGTVEFFHQTYQNINQIYTAFLPFVNVQYSPISKFSVTAKYHAWPTYPDIGQLSPFMAQMDTLTWSVGNPDLKPANYQEASLQFNILQRFTIEPFYAFDHSNIQQYLWENDNQFFQSNINANKFKIYGLRINFTYPLLKMLYWQNYMDLENVHLSYTDVSNKGTKFQLVSTLVYNMQKWNGMAGAGLQKICTKNPILQGYNMSGSDALFLLIRKNFFKNKLNCGFLYSLPVTFLQSTNDTKIQTPTYYSFASSGFDLLKNAIIFQLTYHFSTGKQINVKKSSLDDEIPSPTQTKKGSGLF